MYIYEKWWKFITFFIFFCYKNTNLRSWSRKYSKNVSRAVCCTGAGNSRASLLVLHGKLGSTRRFSSMDARLQILRSRRCTGCPVKMVFFSQKFSLFCHLSLASTGLQLVVQKLASQYTIGVTVSVHSHCVESFKRRGMGCSGSRKKKLFFLNTLWVLGSLGYRGIYSVQPEKISPPPL